MSEVPLSTEGIPLTELIGKEVNVKIISGRSPITRLMHNQRCLEVLWHIEPVSSTEDYKLRILLINRRKRSRSAVRSYDASYWIYYSVVELSQVKNGTEFDVSTSIMQERLSAHTLNGT